MLGTSVQYYTFPHNHQHIFTQSLSTTYISSPGYTPYSQHVYHQTQSPPPLPPINQKITREVMHSIAYDGYSLSPNGRQFNQNSLSNNNQNSNNIPPSSLQDSTEMDDKYFLSFSSLRKWSIIIK